MEPRQKSKDVTRQRIRKGLHVVKRGETWYAEECTKGQQSRRSLQTESLGEAIRRAEQGWTPEEVPPPLPNSKALDVLTVGKALEEYKAWYTKNRRSADRALFSLQPFVDQVGKMSDVKAITREQLQRFVDSRQDGRSAHTVRGDFARCRAFLRWIGARKDLPALFNVCRGIDQPRDEDTTREAPAVEKVRLVLRKLAESGHPWMHDYARLLAETGMRPAELLGLRGVDVKGKLVSIAPWEGRDLKSKWSKRTLEVNENARAMLDARKEKMLDKTVPVFATEIGTVYKERSVGHLFSELLAGGRGRKVPAELRMTLYDFRHFFASEHAAPGPQHMEIERLAAHLGHSPAGIKVLLRWYADQAALRRGAAMSVLGEQKDGEVLELKKA